MNRFGAALGLWLFAASCRAEVSAQSIALNCQNCHGNSSGIVALHTVSADEIYQKLLAYKNNKLPATLMPRIAKGYTDTELKAVANYLGRP